MSIINRITTWTVGQLVTSAALNGEFNNMINFLNAVDGASTAWDNVKTGTLTVTGTSILGTTTISGTTTIPGAKWDLIQAITAANQATVSFTSISNTTYNAYKIILDNVVPVTDNTAFGMQVSVAGVFDAGVSSYESAMIAMTSSAVTSSGNTSASTIDLGAGGSLGTDANEYASFEITVYNPTSGTHKQVNWTGHLFFSSVYSSLVGGGRFLNSTANIDGIRFLMSSGNISTGTFYLYGLRNA
jgi:hypothetical protein